MPKQMTDADELAIWREFNEAYRVSPFALKDGTGFYASGGKWTISLNGGASLASGDSLPQLIFDYRQRLAEEREAKKSPREKRVENALSRFVDYCQRHFQGPSIIALVDAATEALKED